MRAYELMVIFDPDAADATIQGHLKTLISETVESDGGSVAKVDNWGKRRFAYRIKYKGLYALEGNYVVLEILLPERKDLSVQDRALRLADDVVRHKIIRLPEGEATKRGLLGAATPA
jgi:small subunit ribosomal protein S6